MIQQKVVSRVNDIKSKYKEFCTDNILKTCEKFYDATTLNITDSHESVTEFTNHILNNYPSVASICVSPNFIEDVGLVLGESEIGITATVGGFPMGQTFFEVKILECSMSIENGADEVDFVIDVASANNGNWEIVEGQIEELVEEIDSMAISKAILEVGELKDLDTVYKASEVALLAGVDFIKTSTGKVAKGADIESFVTMCLAIKDFYTHHQIKKGIKVAGGIRSTQDLALYYTAVKEILGEEWLNPDLFRIGTSSLVK